MIIKNFIKLSILPALFMTLFACGGDPLRLNVKRSPDEFAVLPRAPLSLPPDYALLPPKPTPHDPYGNSVQRLAEATIVNLGEKKSLNKNTAIKTNSSEDAELINRMAVSGIDPNIRTQVEQETEQSLSKSRLFARKLMFWKNKEDRPGTIVDPAAELKRIQNNKAQGKSLSDGETPTIEVK